MKLKPCPFCGGEATIWNGNIDDNYSDVYYDVYCTACNCMTPKFHTEESAITFWNRREPIDKIVKQLEEQKIPNWSTSKTEKILRRRNFEDAIEIVKGGVSNA